MIYAIIYIVVFAIFFVHVYTHNALLDSKAIIIMGNALLLPIVVIVLCLYAVYAVLHVGVYVPQKVFGN